MIKACFMGITSFLLLALAAFHIVFNLVMSYIALLTNVHLLKLVRSLEISLPTVFSSLKSALSITTRELEALEEKYGIDTEKLEETIKKLKEKEPEVIYITQEELAEENVPSSITEILQSHKVDKKDLYEVYIFLVKKDRSMFMSNVFNKE